MHEEEAKVHSRQQFGFYLLILKFCCDGGGKGEGEDGRKRAGTGEK